MFGLDIPVLIINTFLLAANPVQCTVPQAPLINIIPTTEAVEFDYSKSAEELSLMGNNTILPYPTDVDVVSGGLRIDRPVTTISIIWGYKQYQKYDAVCMWYEQVEITIALSPIIYVAKEFDQPECKSAILEHELKHVEMDRIVINKYAQDIGLAIQSAVNNAGALGPYRLERMSEAKKKIKRHIESTIESRELLLFEEMSEKQQEIDSLEEYEAIRAICRDKK